MLRDASAAIPETLWSELLASLHQPDESAAVLLAGIADMGDRCVLTINRVLWVPVACYVERTPNRLNVASAGWMRALKAAERLGLHPIFFHTHPNHTAEPSPADYAVDEVLAETFAVRAGVSRYASIILGGNSEAPTFSGRVIENAQAARISRLRIVGNRLQILPGVSDSASISHDAVHARQILAFGKAGQQILSRLHVGVAGSGGTGSAVIEQLTRLGVGHITVVDDDRLTNTNVSRVYGSSIAQEGAAKVNVAETNVDRIGLGTILNPVNGRVTSRDPLAALCECDVVFGCTDDHAGRINLSKLAYCYLIPLIDMGVVIDSHHGDIRSITARVTWVGPGEPCLICRGTVSPDIAREELMDPTERARLAKEGYARGLGEPDPAVVAYTTLAAATAVADLLERLFGFGAPDIPGELIIRIADRKMKGRRATPTPGHFCAQLDQFGRGDQPNFLGQPVWPQ